ncbi:MAG: DUF3108 domain-containing protein [Proteobacteria bacterium]|nr:DUF3108 domain-containing protein [Pseudomonadota bacterium]
MTVQRRWAADKGDSPGDGWTDFASSLSGKARGSIMRAAKTSQRALLAVGIAMLCATPAYAGDTEGTQDPVRYVELSTPQYQAYEAPFEPQMGTYTYEVSWNGIPAAEATLTVGAEDLRYRLVAVARTYAPINMLYDLQYRAEGIIDASDMSSLHTSISQKENSREKRIEMSFRQGGEVESVRTQPNKPPQITKLDTNNMTLDPFGAAFLARGLRWEVGETKYFDTFNGKIRYLIALTAEGKETVKVNGQKRSCWVIVPTVRKVNSDEPPHKLRRAKIFLTDDPQREVVKIVSEVFIGAVTTKLIRFESSETPPPIRMAQVRARALIK